MIRRRMSTIVVAAGAIMGCAIMFYHAGHYAYGWLLGGIAVGVFVGNAILIVCRRLR